MINNPVINRLNDILRGLKEDEIIFKTEVNQVIPVFIANIVKCVYE